jgi:putative PIN family toxin of toxin-antitoxin system
MRIMIDSNIVVSSLVFKSANMGKVIECICSEHELCIASCCMDEIRTLMSEKFSNAESTLDEFFAKVPHTLLQSPENPGNPLFKIRDPNDYLVLHTAIIEQVDMLVTGDRDFFDVKIDRPEIIHPMDFLNRFSGESVGVHRRR